MRILTVLFSLLIATATLGGCASRTQVQAKDNSATIAPTVEGDTTTEVAPEPDHHGKGHHKDARAEGDRDRHDDD